MHVRRFHSVGVAALLIVVSPVVLAAQGYVKVQIPKKEREILNRPVPPAPPPSAPAQQKTMIGHDSASINTAENAQDTDSFWTEQIDLDGDGNVDTVDELWDDESKVFFLSKQGTFTCLNGNTGDGDLLVALYGNGNMAGRPVGSGWWVAQLDAGECGAKAAGLYGCRFNAAGATTECGGVMIDEKKQDVTIKAAKISKDRQP
jgi:hypothetical protein